MWGGWDLLAAAEMPDLVTVLRLNLARPVSDAVGILLGRPQRTFTPAELAQVGLTGELLSAARYTSREDGLSLTGPVSRGDLQRFQRRVTLEADVSARAIEVVSKKGYPGLRMDQWMVIRALALSDQPYQLEYLGTGRSEERRVGKECRS